jgi:hypothetical protein
MSWETFSEGIDRLYEQLDGRTDPPDISFGINEGGLIIAAYLSGRLWRTAKYGIIKTDMAIGHQDRNFPQFVYPEIEGKINRIAVFDSEIKTGRSIDVIIKKFKEKYGQNIVIFYVVLVGVTEKHHCEINSVNNFGIYYKFPKNEITNLEDRGINFPNGIKENLKRFASAVYKRKRDFVAALENRLRNIPGIQNNDYQRIISSSTSSSISKPDFMAFYINYPGFELPGKIR